MKRTQILVAGATVLVLVFAVACGPSQVAMDCTPYATPEELAQRPSPYDSFEVEVDSSRAKVCYSRPFANGRVVFGGLVPWDTLWRTGANEPTILYLSDAAEIAGIPVERGRYAIYTVPRQGEWAVVVNGSTGQWGQTRDVTLPDGRVSTNSYTADVEADEVGRSPINTRAIAFTDQFTGRFEPSPDGLELQFDWETTRAVVPIRFRTAR